MALRPVQRGGESGPASGDRSSYRHILYVEDEDLNWHVTERRLREFAPLAADVQRTGKHVFEHVHVGKKMKLLEHHPGVATKRA